MRDTGSRLGAIALLGFILVLPGCGGRGSSNAIPPDLMQTPKSASPGSITVAPMLQTAIQQASVMSSRRPQSDIQGLGWTQLPGGGIYVAASPDGSLWVLSSVGSGLDRSIWHYVNGVWTNIPGAAMRMAFAPDGTLWVINSAGGIYAYNGSWTGIAGGASDITVGANGSVYVISNQGNGIYGRGIWRYAAGSWSQMPGAATRIAASWDTGTYPGKIDPGGFWVTNALGGIYYYSPVFGFNQIPGGVGQVAPTKSGGLFALGYLVNPDGSFPIYYNNLATGSWTQQPGAAASIATDGVSVYVTGAAGGIYKAAVTTRTAPDAPGVGYLAPTSTGSFAGVLTGFPSGATVVGISTDELVGGPTTTIGQGQLAFSLGTSVLSTSRRPASLPVAPSGPHGYLERPVESAAEIDAIVSKLRVRTSTGRAALAYRRFSTLPSTLGAHELLGHRGGSRYERRPRHPNSRDAAGRNLQRLRLGRRHVVAIDGDHHEDRRRPRQRVRLGHRAFRSHRIHRERARAREPPGWLFRVRRERCPATGKRATLRRSTRLEGPCLRAERGFSRSRRRRVFHAGELHPTGCVQLPNRSNSDGRRAAVYCADNPAFQ